MTTWSSFAAAAPELAAFGSERLIGKVAYLATAREDGTPRVHPVEPILGGGRLFVFMEPTSPKGRDLRRNGAYAMHCAVSDTSGQSGEFHVRGRAVFVDDPATRALAVAASSYAPRERYILFELGVAGAASVAYVDGTPVHSRWGQI